MARLFKMFVRKYGQWNPAFELIDRYRRKTNRAMNRALSNEAARYARAMKVGITRGAPGGRPFKPLADITISLKGISKPLIDRFDLVNSIRSKRVFPGVYFAGVLKTEVSSRGRPLVGIAEIHEFGTMIIQRVTELQTKWYGAMVKSGRMKYVPRIGTVVVITIPERPFVAPVWEKLGPKSPKRIMDNFMRNLGVMPGPGTAK